MQFNIRMGGLFRCCVQTCVEVMSQAVEAPKEGDTLTCKYCKKETMQFRAGAWEWKEKP